MAGEEEPSCLLPTAGLTAADNPFERGIVANWDAMEAVWSRAFAQLRVDPEECNMLVTSPLYDTKDNKERLFQTCFETFGAPGVYTSAPAVFELYAAGRENGVVVGCGAAPARCDRVSQRGPACPGRSQRGSACSRARRA